LQFLFVFQFLYPKSIFFESFKWGIILFDFMGFFFKISKLKNDINYIKYKFSHRFGKVCRLLNMYYSKITIIAFFKVKIIFILIIFKNLVWICKECNFNQYWATITVSTSSLIFKRNGAHLVEKISRLKKIRIFHSQGLNALNM
jgi:hypothetical protein